MKKILLVPFMIISLFGSKDHTFSLKELSSIQPGMGTVMMEYGYRFYVIYYAAKANNWDLAKYQLNEQLEIQEVGETTRPEYAEKLKKFESKYLTKLEKDIEVKDWIRFKKDYNEASEACNQCHYETGHKYIQYKLPAHPPTLLKMSL
ncbi:hypothetical protein RZR97_09115 [Hydrogenimonas thermophila]|uniref:hypothetical protein n=1 Tax=Hydrogenimonas thermophila TaxID=223786 RepID=UPI002936E44E|nr:hypothetical protein [Hydrogenimonas thermophila]WOE69270.1 hypothetical protein RZR91_09140 [Hydrogenimonas thermophila]WOE71780.1 hypothetical protein RZR97_09115 [Hydrogenimonas thermophila]